MIIDPVLAGAVVTAFIAGATRGFSGFGGALIFVPLVGALFGPRMASPTFLLIDTLLTLPFLVRALRACIWRQVAPLAVGAVLGVPAGVAILAYLDPLILRWALALLALAMLVPLVAGWRHRGDHRLPFKLALGAASDVLGGAAQMSGPPVVAYWLGSGQPAVLVRANLFAFFALATIASATAYVASGLITAEVVRLALILGPTYAAGLLLGARAFRGASDTHFRVAAYWLVAVAALLSMPLFDGLIGR